MIDARNLNPPMRSSMSPAILDPSGKTVWPDPNAVADVESEFVNETGIALFVSSPQEAIKLITAGVVPLEIRAVASAAAGKSQNTPFRDYAVVSANDAQRIASLGKNCQVVFVR